MSFFHEKISIFSKKFDFVKDFGGLRNPMKVVGNDVIASNTSLGTPGAFPNRLYTIWEPYERL